MSNPLPVSLPAECRKASQLFQAFANPTSGLDKVIPVEVLRKAKGYAFLTVVKAGFLFSARAGTGVVIARLPDGEWSAPSAIGTMGAGMGLQVGAEMAEFIIILNSRAAVKTFQATGSITLGGNMSIAAGPLGRNIEGTGSLSTKGGVAAMYSYSRTKGLFGGASIEGSVIVERSDANAKAYGSNVTAAQLLSGSVPVPQFAEQLIDTLTRRSGSASNWVEDDDLGASRPDVSRGYSFGTAYASGGAGGKLSKSQMQRARSGSGTAPVAPGSPVGGGPLPPTQASFETKFKLGANGNERDYFPAPGGDFKPSSSSGPSGSSSPNRIGSPFESGRDYSSTTSKASNNLAFDMPTNMGRSRSGSGGSFIGKLVKPGNRSRSSTLGQSSVTASDFVDPNRAPWRERESFDSLDDRDEFNARGQRAGRDSFDSLDDEDTGRKGFSSSSPFSSPAKAQTRSRSSTLTKKAALQGKPWDSQANDLMDDFDPFSSKKSPAVATREYDDDLLPGLPATMKRGESFNAVSKQGLGTAIALFSFAGTEAGDLSFVKGDVITILATDDDEWYKGRLRVKEGIFPKKYTEVHMH